MTSKEDDTLPLPGFSQGFSVDVTADEDIIPTSQPQGSSGCSKTSKTCENISVKSTQELNISSTSNSTIDDTLPCEALQRTLDKDKSSDFIPDTETKKIKVSYQREEASCKKKLPIPTNLCHPHSNPLWETPQMPSSPALDSHQFSILNDSSSEPQPFQQSALASRDQPESQIVVNDSADTLYLERSPVKKKIKADDDSKDVGELTFSCSMKSDAGRCEETQILENSSGLLLDQTGKQLSVDESGRSMNGTMSGDVYLVKTVDDSESDVQMNSRISGCTPPAVPDTLEKTFDVKEESLGAGGATPNGVRAVEEVPGDVMREQNLATRKLEFKLIVTCFVTVDTKTNKVLKKFVSEVRKNQSSKPKASHLEQRFSDNASDKRYSTSSSGSVYSDKLPFPLPKRISTLSENTDSSEEDFMVRLKQERQALKRVPWSYEYLLPLKLDELVQMSIENQEFLDRPSLKPKGFCRNVKHSDRGGGISSSLERKSSLGLEEARTETPEVEPACAETVPGEAEVKEGGGEGGCGSGEGSEKQEEEEEEKKKEEEGGGGGGGGKGEEGEERPGAEGVGGEGRVGAEEGSGGERNRSCVGLCEGASVFARWTDKRYYSGVLCGSEKSDRWEVKFDDGTLKVVREDFIMPTDWIEVGALVFALVGDKYISGQVMEIKRGKEISYEVELDIEKQKITASASDLCLTDVMAWIIREKYKPLSGTPRGNAEIDFDNVVSGKRLREQRTPLRSGAAVGSGSSGSKNKSSSKRKKDVLEKVQETEETGSSGKRSRALKSENGHLTVDKAVSTDSPSGNEVGDRTPVRRASRETGGKTKPRMLSYEAEDTRTTRSKLKSWLAADGTPIPGPSGVKPKRQKGEQTKRKVEQEKSGRDKGKPGLSLADTPSAEKNQKKRKLEESTENNSLKSLKKGNVRVKKNSRM